MLVTASGPGSEPWWAGATGSATGLATVPVTVTGLDAGPGWATGSVPVPVTVSVSV